MWFLIDGDDKSLCLVFEKNILQAGTILNKGDEVNFFHRGKSFTGRILYQNVAREAVEEELGRTKAEMAKEAKQKAAKALKDPPPLPPKRKIGAPVFYGTSSTASKGSKKKTQSEGPKMSEDEKKRQRILALNKTEAQKHSNRKILENFKPKDKDDDWVPSEDDISMDSVIRDNARLDDDRKKIRTNLLAQILNEDSSDESGHNDFQEPTPIDNTNPDNSHDIPSSPSKDELKRQLELLRQELQAKANGFQPNSPLSPEKIKKNPANGTPNKKRKLVNDGLNVIGNTPKKQKKSADDLDSANSSPNKKRHGGSGLTLSSPLGEHKEDSFSNSLNDSSNAGEDEEVPMTDYSDLDYQLYENSENTKILCQGIYCKTDAITKAISGSQNVNHVFRRLMEGVFKAEKIQNCTVTGQSWHAGGDDEKGKDMTPLHPLALKAIVAFGNKFAKTHKWPTKKFEKAKQVFAVKLTEIKKKFNKKK